MGAGIFAGILPAEGLPSCCPKNFWKPSKHARHVLHPMWLRPTLVTAFRKQANLFDSCRPNARISILTKVIYRMHSKWRMVIVILIALVWFSSLGTSCEEGRQRMPELLRAPATETSEVTDLIQRAKALPPEFSADMLMRIIESHLVTDKPREVELLQEAFRAAAKAQLPVRRKVMAGSLADTRSGYLAMAYDSKLDTLSMQSRAVKLLLSRNRTKARELLEDISPPPVENLDCQDTLVYDVSELYEAVRQIAEQTFTGEEIVEGSRFLFLDSYVSAVHHPSQIEPVARMLTVLTISDDERQRLISSFVRALQKVNGDDRSFSESLISVSRTIRHLNDLLRTSGSSGIIELLRSYRQYLVRNLNGPRCGDNVLDNGERIGEKLAIEEFNEGMMPVAPSERMGISSIGVQEVNHTKSLGSKREVRYWQSAKSKEFLFRIKALRFGDGKEPLAESERQKASWHFEVSQFLSDLTGWTARDEEAKADYFHQKCVLLRGVLELSADIELRGRVLDYFISFISAWAGEDIYWSEWNIYLEYILHWQGSVRAEERGGIQDRLKMSRDPIIQAYALLNGLLMKKS